MKNVRRKILRDTESENGKERGKMHEKKTKGGERSGKVNEIMYD